jgi:hypothetical protein
LPEPGAAIGRVQTRWRVRAAALTLALAATAFAVAYVISTITGSAPATARIVGLMAAIVAAIVSRLRLRSLPAVAAARLIEARNEGLDNLLVTAAELEARPRPVRADIRDAIVAQAEARTHLVNVARTVPLGQPLAVAAMAMVGAALLLPLAPSPQQPAPAAATGTGTYFTVRVTPPAYTHRRAEEFVDPVEVTAIAGSRIHIAAAAGRTLREWVATESTGLELEIDSGRRFLAVTVVPDAQPNVRIATPGKDRAFAEPKGRIDVNLQSSDDLGLSTLALRFTKASGGGENVSFTDGELPVSIDRRDERHWNARATIDLGALGLEDGDIVVYRAIARDNNPQGAPVQSEQYLIEIGKNSGVGDAGFALPAEEKKYAISQQMVIYKTEQLLAAAGKGARAGTRGDAWLEQTRMIAVEQRMVRAEVVFLGGGEVEDEVEEASRSDELSEGRLQNTGRIEMLRAINAMSRAEALLNDGSAEQALVFERQALASLERALDRRRYFLRTLPDRSRIDTTRRLTGERRDAKSWERPGSAASSPGSLDAQRQLMRELAAGPIIDARLAARVAAVDPASLELQRAAVALASASSGDSGQAAIRQAMTALTNHALQTLPRSSTVDLYHDPLAGRLASELAARPRQ